MKQVPDEMKAKNYKVAQGRVDYLKYFREKYHKKTNAVVMGNGPSLKSYDLDKIKLNCGEETIFLACNRISNLFFEKSLKWRPDIFTCFTSTSLTCKDWKKSIDRCLLDERIDSFVFEDYRKVTDIEKFHKNVFFCKNVLEHNRHEKIQNNFINLPLEDGFLKSYSATVSLFQMCNWLEVQNIFIAGQDGYTKPLGENHFSKTYNYEPNNFQKSNNRILNIHKVLKEFFNEKNVNVFNTSSNSILQKIYEYKDLNSL